MLLLSISLLEKMDALWSNRKFWVLVIPAHISKANLKEFVGVLTKAKDSVRDLRDTLPEKVSMNMLKASKYVDIEVSRTSVAMAKIGTSKRSVIKRCRQNITLLQAN